MTFLPRKPKIKSEHTHTAQKKTRMTKLIRAKLSKISDSFILYYGLRPSYLVFKR